MYWPDTLSNVVDPGWVPTKMGGASATDDLELGHLTQTWLAVSNDPEATVTGGYWHHRQQQTPAAATRDPAFQDDLMPASWTTHRHRVVPKLNSVGAAIELPVPRVDELRVRRQRKGWCYKSLVQLDPFGGPDGTPTLTQNEIARQVAEARIRR